MTDRQLIADLLSALEYHTEQTRRIEFSKVAIEAAREYLRKPKQPPQSVTQKHSSNESAYQRGYLDGMAKRHQPLTDEQIIDIVDIQRAKVVFDNARLGYRVARAIEAAHQIGVKK